MRSQVCPESGPLTSTLNSRQDSVHSVGAQIRNEAQQGPVTWLTPDSKSAAELRREPMSPGSQENASGLSQQHCVGPKFLK